MPPAKIVTKTEYVTPTAPIVPKPDALALRDVKFIIITPENASEVFAKLKDEKVLFALTAKGYEDTALNLSDIRAYVRQQNRVIILYKDSFKPVNPEPIK